MASTIAQLASSPLLTQFAITASQKAVRPVGNFISPLCEVPDMNFRYKVYTDKHRYKVPNTRRPAGSPATVLGFSADDVSAILEPNALDFPIPNAGALSEESLSYSIMEAQSILADASALALEQEILNIAIAGAAAASGTAASDFTSSSVDPISVLDDAILTVTKAAKNGAAVKVLFGTTKFKQFRNNSNVRSRFIIGKGAAGSAVIAPNINDVGSLLMTNPEVQLSMMVVDTAAAGLSESISFLLDTQVIVFASNSTPNRMDPSFMKTFARMGGFFQPGQYVSTDQRDEVLKMDWFTLPKITNTAAVIGITTS